MIPTVGLAAILAVALVGGLFVVQPTVPNVFGTPPNGNNNNGNNGGIVTVSPATVSQGGTMTVSVTNFAPNQSVQVNINGAAHGYLITNSNGAGSTVITTTNALGSGLSAGTYQLTAVSQTKTATTPITVVFTSGGGGNPGPDPNVQKVDTGIIVALYIYPGADWSKLAEIQKRHPAVPTLALVNPNNGPGNSLDNNYVNGLKQLEDAGITACGYVPTYYAKATNNPPVASPYTGILYTESVIRSYIDRWTNSPTHPTVPGYGVDCIFFDEMENKVGKEWFYTNIDDYAKSKGVTFTIGNPGTDTTSTYIGTVDNIMIRERTGLPTISELGGWHTSYAKANFSADAYNVPTLPNQATFNTYTNYVSYIYITDDGKPIPGTNPVEYDNPWNTLPSYLEQEYILLERS